MKRIFFIAAALAALPSLCRAEDAAIELNVQPMSAPKPALKYQLLPAVRELKPGNPAQYYLRCFAEQRNFFFNKESVAQRERYRTMPLAELRKQKVGRYGGNALSQVDWAARLNAIDWQILERLQSEGMDLRLPELGPLRILATALQARLRIEVAARRFDAAVMGAKTMFALARHLGEYPSEDANRLGLWLANRTLDTLEEMVQQPGCPNLYWAFTDLPCPLVDVRKGLQAHDALVAAELRPLRDDVVAAAGDLEKLVSRLSGVMGFAREQRGQSPRSLRGRLTARVKDAARVSAARDRLFAARCAALIDRGNDEETLRASFDRLLKAENVKDQIDKFSPLQVVLLDEKHEYEVRRDEGMKLLSLAPWQIDALPAAEKPGRGEGLLADLLPRAIEARRAQARFEQRIALLRHVEALRLHAAAHDGKLPQKLSDIAVPLPVDPFTGKAFVYKVEEARAHLRGGEKTSAHPMRYEVTIRK